MQEHMTRSVRIMREDAEIAATFDAMKELRTHLAREEYTALVQRLMRERGFVLAAVLEEGHVKAVAGYHYGESLAWGKYLYVDDLSTPAAQRSSGYGKLLLDWLKEEARRQGCRQLHLDSGVQRHAAHRFYLRERMDITCFHFALSL
jgi:GNAT superfamily N-acetyltransferase